MSKEWGPEDIFDVLASETAREILLLCRSNAMSAEELAAACDVSKPTVYRRVNKLHEYDLLERTATIDEDGRQFNRYETNLDRICFDFDDGDIVVRVRFEERDVVDRFVSAWADLQGSENGEA